ncbi:MAG: hypothetical protein K2N44_08020, partial [Lachnospiraceae bacterium]|nr:hypothetical protein [Lachnospiraceae bacterium]
DLGFTLFQMSYKLHINMCSSGLMGRRILIRYYYKYDQFRAKIRESYRNYLRTDSCCGMIQ